MAVYDKLYVLYRQLHDSFGGLDKSIDLSRFMKALIEIKYAEHA
jgi:L-ribulokinase